MVLVLKHGFLGKSLLQISKVCDAKTLAHLSGVLLAFIALKPINDLI